MRKGLRKVRHIEVNQLWVQEAVATGRIMLSKVGTQENLADVLTKHLNKDQMNELIGRMGLNRMRGRHWLAPEI